MKTLVLICAALTLAAGCATTTVVHYYTLDMASSGHTAAAVNVAIDRLRCAEPLVRKEILIKKTPTEIEYYASDQWAAGVDEMVSEKLQEEFGPPLESRKTILISGQIQAFEQIDTEGAPEAHVKLTVEFRADRYGETLLTKVYETRAPATDNSASAVVAGLSQALEQIAGQIAGDAAKL